MRKFLSLLAIMMMAVTSAWADDPDYLCFTAEEATDVAFKISWGSSFDATLQYSTNKTTWTDYTLGTNIPLAKDAKVYFKAGKTDGTVTSNTTFNSQSSSIKFTSTKKVAASGNIMSLLDATCESKTVPAYAFYCLFQDCTSLTTAPELKAETLAESCYSYMFQRCTSLTEAPKLEATTLAGKCYSGMFQGCTSLTAAPKLEATKLASNCCEYMFQDCTNLTTAPELKATTLASNCYYQMFKGCTSLKTAPKLEATKLASECCEYMFQDCTSLTTAPKLPATTLADACYREMFSGCTSLTAAPELPATELASNCYRHMFLDCSSLTTAPVLPATTLASNCYYEMFSRCTSLTTAPALPATTLASNCYYEMFYSCTSLTAAPALPATELADYCYYQMFQECTSLTTAPALPATTLAEKCYNQMFKGCTNLTTAPALPATTLTLNCYLSMFRYCKKLIVNKSAPGIEWTIPDASSNGKTMFDGTGGNIDANPTAGTYFIASLPAVQLNSKGYATYSSAQNVDIETEGVKAYTATASGSTITLNEIASGSYIPAGVGVVLYGGDAMANKVVTFKTAVNTTAASTTGNALKSTLVAVDGTAGAYKVDAKPTTGYTFALGDGSTFLHYTGTSFIANRAYFNLTNDPTVSSGAKALTTVFGDEATGITSYENETLRYENENRKYMENGHIVILKNGKKFNANGQQIK